MLQSQNDITIRYDANSSGQVSIQQSRLLLWSWVKFYFFQEIQRGVKKHGLDFRLWRPAKNTKEGAENEGKWSTNITCSSL